MRLFFFFHPFSGSVRDLHRFLLTRCAVVVLTGLGGLGGHFAEGDEVEPSQELSAQLSNEVELPATEPRAPRASEPKRPSWALGGVEQRAWQSVRRSARGETAALEVALLDAPLSDVPLDGVR